VLIRPLNSRREWQSMVNARQAESLTGRMQVAIPS
jgi:hypothetical protein